MRDFELPRMTAPALWDFMDRLTRESQRISVGWYEASQQTTADLAHPMEPEMYRKMADKWEQLSQVFLDARHKIYTIAQEDFRKAHEKEVEAGILKEGDTE